MTAWPLEIPSGGLGLPCLPDPPFFSVKLGQTQRGTEQSGESGMQWCFAHWLGSCPAPELQATVSQKHTLLGKRHLLSPWPDAGAVGKPALPLPRSHQGTRQGVGANSGCEE